MTQAASTVIRITIPAMVIMRWDCVMFLTRRIKTIPHTPIAVMPPRTARARTTREGKFTAALPSSRRDWTVATLLRTSPPDGKAAWASSPAAA